MTFSAWLNLLPAGIPMLVVVGTFVVVGPALALVLRALVRPSTLKQHNDIAGFVFAAIGAIYAVLLAFVVFVVWEQHSTAAELAENEAMHATSLYRSLAAYPDQAQVQPAMAALEAFTVSVVREEYPALWRHESQGSLQASARTDARYGALWDAARRVAPRTMQEQSLFEEQLKDITQLGETRLERLMIAREDLPRVIWLAIVIGGLVTAGYPALFGHEKAAPILVLSALVGIVVGFAVLIIVRLNYPFLGTERIEPEGYDLLMRLAKW